VKSPLLSIITPSYNCGAYIHRLLDSILQQSYPSVEMFLIDDGSTDNTREVVLPYLNKFNQRGYQLNYIYQENAGQSVALNRGLKMIHGDFLVWPDADDWYKSAESLGLLVNALMEQDETVGFARCDAELIHEERLEVTGYHRAMSKNVDYIFDECFFEKNGFWVVPGDFVVRTSALDKTIKGREIYTEKKACQNLQLLYPILYSYKCYSIKSPLYCILQRANSYSRRQRTGTEMADLLRLYARTRLATLNRMYLMASAEKEKYCHAVYMMYRDDIIHMYIDDGNIDAAKAVISVLRKQGISIPFKYRVGIRFNKIYRTIKNWVKT